MAKRDAGVSKAGRGEGGTCKARWEDLGGGRCLVWPGKASVRGSHQLRSHGPTCDHMGPHVGGSHQLRSHGHQLRSHGPRPSLHSWHQHWGAHERGTSWHCTTWHTAATPLLQTGIAWHKMWAQTATGQRYNSVPLFHWLTDAPLATCGITWHKTVTSALE